jgi:hypothetical protein
MPTMRTDIAQNNVNRLELTPSGLINGNNDPRIMKVAL